MLSKFANTIVQKFDFFLENLVSSKLVFVYFPGALGFLGFLEVVGFVGAFLPFEIICVSSFAFIHDRPYLFLFTFLFLFAGVYLGMIVGYFLGKKLCRGYVCSLESKYELFAKYFKQIEEYIHKYHYRSFFILFNIGIIRPFVSIYFGSRDYDFKKYVLGSLIGTVSYLLPRVGLGYLVGVFGKIIFSYLKVGYKYILYAIIVLLILSFVVDIFTIKKNKQGKTDNQ